MTRRRKLLALAATAGVALAAALALRDPARGFARVREGSAARTAEGAQVLALAVEGGEYVPNLVHARAGVPLRLRVEVRDRHGCATRILVPELGVDLALQPGATAEALVPPAPPGKYVFTCGKKMVKGVLVLE